VLGEPARAEDYDFGVNRKFGFYAVDIRMVA